MYRSEMGGELTDPSVSCADPVSLRFGHLAGLTVHRTVIQYRSAASLPYRGANSKHFVTFQGRQREDLFLGAQRRSTDPSTASGPPPLSGEAREVRCSSLPCKGRCRAQRGGGVTPAGHRRTNFPPLSGQPHSVTLEWNING